MTRDPASLGIPQHALEAYRAIGAALTSPAPCQGEDMDRWHGNAEAQRWAAEQCLDCPAMTACLSYARRAGERDGTWGGATAKERWPK